MQRRLAQRGSGKWHPKQRMRALSGRALCSQSWTVTLGAPGASDAISCSAFFRPSRLPQTSQWLSSWPGAMQDQPNERARIRWAGVRAIACLAVYSHQSEAFEAVDYIACPSSSRKSRAIRSKELRTECIFRTFLEFENHCMCVDNLNGEIPLRLTLFDFTR